MVLDCSCHLLMLRSEITVIQILTNVMGRFVILHHSWFLPSYIIEKDKNIYHLTLSG